ncbi:hypothetical protein GQR58_012732 [Nymphon striatum]|nr:hypothetical protein GQR58_012732 [Nymphon striatum]
MIFISQIFVEVGYANTETLGGIYKMSEEDSNTVVKNKSDVNIESAEGESLGLEGIDSSTSSDINIIPNLSEDTDVSIEVNNIEIETTPSDSNFELQCEELPSIKKNVTKDSNDVLLISENVDISVEVSEEVIPQESEQINTNVILEEVGLDINACPDENSIITSNSTNMIVDDKLTENCEEISNTNKDSENSNDALTISEDVNVEFSDKTILENQDKKTELISKEGNLDPKLSMQHVDTECVNDDSSNSSDNLMIVEDETVKKGLSEESTLKDVNSEKSLESSTNCIINYEEVEGTQTNVDECQIKDSEGDVPTIPQDINMNIVKFQKTPDTDETENSDIEVVNKDKTISRDIPLKMDISEESGNGDVKLTSVSRVKCSVFENSEEGPRSSTDIHIEKDDKIAKSREKHVNLSPQTAGLPAIEMQQNIANNSDSSPATKLTLNEETKKQTPVKSSPANLTPRSSIKKNTPVPITDDVLKPFDIAEIIELRSFKRRHHLSETSDVFRRSSILLATLSRHLKSPHIPLDLLLLRSPGDSPSTQLLYPHQICCLRISPPPLHKEVSWRRELVYRTTSSESPLSKRQADVYYYTPENTKLRSMPEILGYLKLHHNSCKDFSRVNFTFCKQQIYHEPLEIVRNAKDAKTKVPRSPAVKTLTPKQPINYQLPDRSLPQKRKIKPINREYPYTELTKSTSSPVTNKYNGSHVSKPTSSDEIVKPPIKKARIKITPTMHDVSLSRAKCDADKVKKSEPEVIEPVHISPPVIAEDLLPLCSMSCPGQQNTAPSLLCCVCLCLFHPECVKYNSAHGPNLVCQRCLKGIREGKTTAPLALKDTLLDLLFPECSKNDANKDAELKNNQSTSSMPISVANALSLQSVVHSSAPTMTSKSVDLAPNVSLPLSIQKSSFMKKSIQPNSSVHQSPSISEPPTMSNCVAGTLIFTNKQSSVNNSQTLVNTQTAGSSVLQVRFPNVNPSVTGQPMLRPIIPNNAIPISSTPAILPSPNNKYVLNMMPDSGGRVRYLLSPVDNSIPRVAAPPIPSYLDNNAENLADNNGQNLNSVPALDNNESSKMSNSITATAVVDNDNTKKYLVDRQLKRRAVITEKNPFFQLQCGYTSFMAIFQYLSVRDLLSCGQVCKTWKDLANQPALWDHVNMNKVIIKDWQRCAQFLSKRGTTNLNLVGIASSDDHTMWRDFLYTLRYFGSLKVLIFNKVTASVLLAVSDQLSNLEVLCATDIFDSTITQFGGNCYLDVSKLQQLQNLLQVQLHSSSEITVPSCSFTSLKYLRNLTVLSLTSFKGLTSESIFFLKLLPYLQELEIGKCSLFDSQAYETISSMMSLRKLKLEVTENCSDSIARCLVNLPE